MPKRIGPKEFEIIQRFGHNLNMLMKRNNLKKKDLAEWVDVEESVVSKWVTAKLQPTFVNFNSILDFLSDKGIAPLPYFFPKLASEESKILKETFEQNRLNDISDSLDYVDELEETYSKQKFAKLKEGIKKAGYTLKDFLKE